MRPSDWFLVRLPGDPVPGDAFGVRRLAASYSAISEVAGEAAAGVRRARSSGAASEWIGDAGDVFRDRSRRMPGELTTADRSYEVVARALGAWATAIDDAQSQADRGLQQAREATADLVAATAALDQAQASWSTVHAQQLGYQRLQKTFASVPPPPGVTMPADVQLRSAARGAATAQSSIALAHRQLAEADARLAAARALVLDAQSRRDDAEATVVHTIDEAADLAVKPSSIWEAIQDSAAWQTIVVLATVLLTVLTIVLFIVGGPLVWALLIAATVLLLVDCLLTIAQGENAWGELAMLGIGLIPGGRLLGLAAKGVDAAGRAGAAGSRLAAGVQAVTGAVRGGSELVTHVVSLAGDRLADTAAGVAQGALRAIHSGSADRVTLDRFFAEHYGDLAKVNSGNYLTGGPLFATNCVNCVAAVEHALDGAVHAAAPSVPQRISELARDFGQTGTMADWVDHVDFHSVVSTMEGLGSGARGIVCGGRDSTRSSHVFNVVFDSNGIVFLDGQVGRFAELEAFDRIRLLISREGTP